MGAIVVAGWFVSIILNEMLERMKSLLSQSEKILELREALKKMEPITNQVERYMLNGDNSFADYFNPIKEALYEAQDALGEHIYLTKQQERQNQLVRIVKYPYEGIKQFLWDKHNRKMTRVINNLNKISASEVRAILEPRSGSSRHVPASESNHFHQNNCTSRDAIPASEFLGRSERINSLVTDLTDPTCSDVVAIVGECGIGKTTLAQHVCGDPRIVKYFTDKGIVWIWAAPMDNKVEITKQILKAVVSDSDKHPALGDQFDQVKRMLEEELTKRRILLVLDDVGINHTTTCARTFNLWNEVLSPIKGANSGSRVLVTTQWKNVAEVMKVRKPIFLKGLHEEECQAIFEKAAFQGRGDLDPLLRETGKKIIAKAEINGSPYLAKAAGEKLKGNTNRRDWDKILNDEKELYEGIVSDLKSRFQYLPEHLKRCFAFCSIFPKNWKFKRDSLVKMWISQAFIAAEENETVDVGRKYFKELESWSFFQKIDDQYTISYPMHYLAQSVSCYDCARIEGDKQGNVPDTVRHLSITTSNLSQLKKLGPQLKKLRTLLIIRDSNSPSSSNSNPPPAIIEEKVFSELKRLRLLDLSGCDMTALPQSILKFMHLRYLALCETLTTLPEQMDKLLLKILVIPKKCNLNKIPSSLAKVYTMEHLDMDRVYFQLALDIGEMTKLQSSVTFCVSNEGTNLNSLKNLNNLCKELIIRNLENVPDGEGASKAQLCKKKHLEVLQLEWRRDTESAVNVLNGLQPPKELKTLHISGYAGPLRLPEWFNDQERNLKYLYLTSCTSWEELPPLGNLPYLVTLHLTGMPSLQQITHSFYGEVDEPFKYLKKLIFEKMSNLKSWVSPSTDKKMFLPRLQKLKILNCPKLETVPVLPETVTKLTIELTKVVSELNLQSVLSTLSINKGPGFNLDINNENIVGEPYLSLKHLQYTWKLSIRNLKHATTEDFEIFGSLKTLHISESEITDEQLTNCLKHLKHLSDLEIESCGNIKSLSIPEQVTPGDLQLRDLQMFNSLASLENNVSIRSLTIQNCPNLTAESFPTNFESLASLKKLWIQNCPKLMSLPSSFPSTLERIHLVSCNPALNSFLKDDWYQVGEVSFERITKSGHPLLRKERKGVEHMVKTEPVPESTSIRHRKSCIITW